jgi:hypothetical protein
LVAGAWLIASCSGPAAAADPVSYTACEAGLDQPEWDGGDTELELADVDGDGHIDIVSVGDHGNPLINTDQEGILVWLGNGRGEWQHVHYGHLGYGGVAVGDVDGDGVADVGYGIHHDYGDGDLGDQLLEVALGDGTGAFWAPWDDGLATHGENWGLFSTDFGDVDGDGDLDVGSIGFGASSGLQVYLNDRDGSWRRSFGFLGGNSRHVFAFGDVDGDGHRDVVAAKEEGTVWRGDGDGFFAEADGNLPATGGLGRRGPSLGDVDADGRDDLAFCDGAGQPEVWLSRGVGVWEDASSGIPALGTCEHTALHDMDGDGTMDLVSFGNGELHVLAGDGTGVGWTEIGHHSTGDDPGSSQAFRVGGDADHNGRPDVVLVDENRLSPFTYRNEIHAYCETSPRSELKVRIVRPGPHRRWLAGATVFVEWAAEVPPDQKATIDLELSLHGISGPWRPIADGLPNSGRHQWTVPAPASNQARLRVTARALGETVSAVSSEPFEIVRRPDPLRVRFDDRDQLSWEDDWPRERYNVYRGGWRRFLESGAYTQTPGSAPEAARACGLADRSHADDFVPAPGRMVYYLVTAYRLRLDGTDPTEPVPMAEGPLGQRSDATMRDNAHPCPASSTLGSSSATRGR